MQRTKYNRNDVQASISHRSHLKQDHVNDGKNLHGNWITRAGRVSLTCKLPHFLFFPFLPLLLVKKLRAFELKRAHHIEFFV